MTSMTKMYMYFIIYFMFLFRVYKMPL